MGQKESKGLKQWLKWVKWGLKGSNSGQNGSKGFKLWSKGQHIPTRTGLFRSFLLVDEEEKKKFEIEENEGEKKTR